MFSKNKAFIILTSLTTVFFVVGINIRNIVMDEFFLFAFQSIFASILIGLSACVISNFILLFFSDKIYTLWLKRIAGWFLGIYIVVIWIGESGNDYASFGLTETSWLLGFFLVSITAIFALTQRFYYKMK